MSTAAQIVAQLTNIQPIFASIGGLIIFAGLFQAVTSMTRRSSIKYGVTQMLIGMALCFAPQVASAVFWLADRATKILFGAGLPDNSTSKPSVPAPDPVAQSPSPSATVDLSWVPGVLVIAGVLAAAVVLGLGVFHYYSKSLSPSLAKRRAEKLTAATLVAEARKTLEWVVLDSASWETDLAKQIDYPMMTDVSELTVGKYVRDMRRAQELERALLTKPLLADAERFSDAVTGLKVSYETAVKRAEKVRWSGFSVAEQKRLKDARIALDVIQDSSTTEEQRNAQYRRISKLLDGLIVLTDPVRLSLARWVPMLELEAGQSTAAETLITGKTPTLVGMLK